MARTTKFNTKIWVRPFTTNVRCKQLTMEEDQVCVDDEENGSDRSTTTVAQCVTEKVQDGPEGVNVLYDCDLELQEEYKHLLVMAIAERTKQKMPEAEIWREIKQLTKFDHKTVWIKLRDITLKKIMRLLPANDLIENIPTEMQLSTTEWLLFDLILVHEKIDVLNIDPVTQPPERLLDLQGNGTESMQEPKCLEDLFELVKLYDIENLVGDALAAAWMRLTVEYNSRGRRCSPMMLQLRWYQMKLMTRRCFYTSYTHNANADIQETLQSSALNKLTVLQIAIAVAYNKIITQECTEWETLVDERRVIMSEEFKHNNSLNNKRVNCSKTSGPSSEPPVLLLKLDENQIAMDLDKTQNVADKIHTKDTIVIDLNDDVEYANALHSVMGEALKCSEEGTIAFRRSEEQGTAFEHYEEQGTAFEHNKEQGTAFERSEEQGTAFERSKEQGIAFEREECGEKFEHTAEEQAKKREDSEDELKRRLIRELARMPMGKKKEILWQKLTRKWGHDCKELWNQMRGATIMKMVNLLVMNDVLQDVLPAMRLSATEWLFLDLILVHEKIQSVTFDKLGKKCLRDLFELVMEYHVENRVGEDLALAWIHLTMKYNSRGRQCSPMLLQLRWYQLKELSRHQVYKSSPHTTRLNNQMLIAIATKYQKIITQKWSPWSTLVQEKKVVLSDQFIRTLKKKQKLIGVEAREGWYLYIKDVSNSGNVIQIDSESVECNSENKFNKTIESTAKDPKQLITPKLNETKEPEIIELDSDDEIDEILREKAEDLNMSQVKVKNVMSLPQIPLDKNIINENPKDRVDADETVHKPVIEASIGDSEPILCDSDDEMDILLQERANLMSIELPESLKSLDNIVGDEVDEFQKILNQKVYGMEVEEAGIINKEMVMMDNNHDGLDDVDFDDNNIEFVDDGIKFEEGNDYKTKKNQSGTVSFSDIEDDNDAEEDDNDPEVDPKLLMNTLVYTKKINCMEVFKFMDYDSVNDKRVIEYVESQSKPVKKRTPKEANVENFRDQAISGYDKNNIQSDDDIQSNGVTQFEIAQNRVKYTSWLLNKPKKRKYNPRQLRNNPDFYTNLKCLTPEFLSSTRNRELLKECPPITIDVHKEFENKLVNGKMYLKRSDFKSAKLNKIENMNNLEDTIPSPSIKEMLTEDQNMKLAQHVRDLIAAITADDQDEAADDQVEAADDQDQAADDQDEAADDQDEAADDQDEAADDQNEGDYALINGPIKLPVKRSKVINLPDKDQIRLINQSLLTAEITPRHQPLLNSPTGNVTESNEISESARIICSTEKSVNRSLKSVLTGGDTRRRRILLNLDTDHSINGSESSEPGRITSISKGDYWEIPNKRLKSEFQISELWPPETLYCCWAREKIVNIKQNLDIGSNEHMCVGNCICCCHLDLVTLLTSQHQSTTKYSPKYSEASDYVVTNGPQYNSKLNNSAPSNHNKIVRNSEDRNLSSIDNVPKGKSNIINFTMDSNISACNEDELCTMTKAVVKRQTAVNALMSYEPTELKEVPSFTKVAPCFSVTGPEMSNSPAYLVLPTGVNFIKLSDGKLAVAINPGVELETEKLHLLMSVCAAVNSTDKEIEKYKEAKIAPLHL